MRKCLINLFLLVSAVCFIFSPFHLQAGEYYLEEWECYLDLPQNMSPMEIREDQATFSDSSGKVFFQIKVYPSEEYSSAAEMFTGIRDRINGEGTGAPFSYRGKDSYLADYRFNIGPTPYRGYSILIKGEKRNWVILSFCEEEIYDTYHFALLSALDSFSIDIYSLYEPGPVSTFYETTHEKPVPVEIEVPFGNSVLKLKADKNSIESSEVTAEREAWVLAGYTPSDTDAWSRFYRMIYRDNYSKIEDLFDEINKYLPADRHSPHEISSRLLEWLQGFSYSRTGTISDLSPPLTALKDHAGDCDSLALLYIMLLKRYRIDAILMVSSEYSHAMAAVMVPGEGARFSFAGRQYLVAEMTDNVSIGKINALKADPAKWLGIQFR